MPIFSNKKSPGVNQGDFYLFPVDSPEEAARWVLEVVCERIPATFGFDPISEIQVLAPMYRGDAGVDNLNEALHGTLNPPNSQRPEAKLFNKIFRVGDKLMQIRNNYDKEVFNGDIGTLADINKIEQTLTLNFEGRYVVYDWSETDQVVRAYAISIHKSQGSEFPAVVIPLVTQHYMMLQRNLLYTAVTRAKKLCVLVGTRQAIGIAVKNNRVSERYSGLAWRLSKPG
jgi:exodeoxyribonuclease V alpha subunit